jgi:hypothetical protein
MFSAERIVVGHLKFSSTFGGANLGNFGDYRGSDLNSIFGFEPGSLGAVYSS